MHITKYEIIRQYVIDQVIRYPQHQQPIMSEREMCQKFGVTRTTVRKALRPLVDSKVLIPHRGSGMYINTREYINSYSRFKKIYKITFLIGNGRVFFFTWFFQRIIANVCRAFSQGTVDIMLNFITGEPGSELAEIMMYHPDAVLWFRPVDAVRPLIAQLRQEIPVCVLLADGRDEECAVTVDYTQAGAQAAQWFGEQGRRQVALLGTSDEEYKSEILSQFRSGWLQAWQEKFGVDNSNLIVSRSGDFAEFLKSPSGQNLDGIFCHGASFTGFAEDYLTLPPGNCPIMTDSCFFSNSEKGVLYPDVVIDLYAEWIFKRAAAYMLEIIDPAAAPPHKLMLQAKVVKFNGTSAALAD